MTGDYRAVLSAINALGANQREQSLRLNNMDGRLDNTDGRLTTIETRARDGFRSVNEHLADIKDLIIGGR